MKTPLDYAEAAMIDRDRLLATLKNMETYGGGFCQALAAAWYRADRGNSAKLATAFPNILVDYAPEKWHPMPYGSIPWAEAAYTKAKKNEGRS